MWAGKKSDRKNERIQYEKKPQNKNKKKKGKLLSLDEKKNTR